MVRQKLILGNALEVLSRVVMAQLLSLADFSRASARATSVRRWVIQYRPESKAPPTRITVGPSPNALAVNKGSGCLGAAAKPSFSKGTSEMKNTDVPPASSLP